MVTSGTSVVLGIDLGTTAVKCAVHDRDGRQLGSSSSEYELKTPGELLVEVAVATYWSAVCDVVRMAVHRAGVRARDVAALAISCQGETLLPVDVRGEPLRDAIVWLDSRAQEEATELAEAYKEVLYEVTGQPEMVPTWPAAKALWLSRHEPGVVRDTAKLVLLEDYVLARMTGEYACEASLATSTCYWDFRKKTWWREMLDRVGFDAHQLPLIVEPGSPIAPLRPQVAEELGLTPKTLVCAGALDQACGAIGVGNVWPGIFSENTGAAVAICSTLDGPYLDPERRMPCHYHGVPDTYMFHTFTGGGVVLQWYRDRFCEAEVSVAKTSGLSAYGLLDAAAASVAPGAEGLTVIPHLQGAMSPESNPHARAAFLGMTLRHGKEHIARAILESIAFVVRHNIEVIESLGIAVDTIRALGGGARSDVWKQIEADVTGRPVSTTVDPDSAATLGASVLAGVALGWYRDPNEAAGKMVTIRRTFMPEDANAETYDEAYARFRLANRLLGPTYVGAGSGS